MKNARILPAMGIVVLFLGFFSACVSQEPGEAALEQSASPKAVQAEPDEVITVRLAPGSLLESNLVRMIERDNAELLGHMEKYRAAAPEDRPSVAKSWVASMQSTYLKDARMTLESGTVTEGWDKIIGAMQEVLDAHASSKLQGVHVEIEYLPYGSEKYVMLNADKKPGEEIDMIFHIKSTIVHQSDPQKSEWEGELPHRRTCDPIW